MKLNRNERKILITALKADIKNTTDESEVAAKQELVDKLGAAIGMGTPSRKTRKRNNP